MFRQFDIDYDKVIFDGVCVQKPKYVSVHEWQDFWKLFDSEGFEFEVNKAFDNGYETRKREEDAEIESLKGSCYEEFDIISDKFEEILANYNLTNNDKILEFESFINKSKDSLWRL